MRNRVFPQPSEVKSILENATGRIQVFATLAAFAGMSSSELRGLHWQNVYFHKRQIVVKQRANEFGEIGPLKRAARYRTIPMTPQVASALREWRLMCPRQNDELVFVFPTVDG